MTLHSEIIHTTLIEVLNYVNREAKLLSIDFYIVGAIARDYHFMKLGDYIPSRRTADIDIAVMVSNETEYIALKKALVKTGYFEEMSEPIKLIYNNSIEIDLLPFGDIETNGITLLTQPKIFTLEMPGFSLVNNYVEKSILSDQLETNICSIVGLVLLKLIAQDDRPQRTKDNADIQQIIKHYFDIYTYDIYEEHFDLMEKYDTNDRYYLQKICAHVIGRQLYEMLKNDRSLLNRVINILNKNKDDFWNNMLEGISESLAIDNGR